MESIEKLTNITSNTRRVDKHEDNMCDVSIAFSYENEIHVNTRDRM